MEMIKFSNSFDTEGPLVPGLSPHAAIQRLGTYIHSFIVYVATRELCVFFTFSKCMNDSRSSHTHTQLRVILAAV